MKRIAKKIVAVLLVCLTVFSYSACSIEFEEPDWIKEKLCDHVFDEQEVLKEATCGASGRILKVCSDCGKTEYDTIKATGEHVFDAGVALENGMKYTCTVCGKTKTEELSQGHSHKDVDFDGKCDECAEDYDIFADGAYTEVDVVSGEYVAGNWYRFYRPTDPSELIYYSYTFSGEWVGSTVETDITFMIRNKEAPNLGYISIAGGMTTCGKFNEIIYIETDEYYDFYFTEGVYTCYENPGTTWELTKETTIRVNGNNGPYIKRLVFN